MAVNYLHGVETVELNKGPRPIRVVKSAVIGLIGLSSEGPRQELTLVQSQADAAQFGKVVTGSSIPHALEAIQAQGSGTVIVINIYDPALHDSLLVESTPEVADGKVQLEYPPILSTLVVKNSDESTTYEEGTDYEIDQYGNLTVLSGGSINEGDTLSIEYKFLDPTKVTPSHFIGAITDGVRTGSKLFELCFQTFGFTPRLFIAPWGDGDTAIDTLLRTLADKYKGHSIHDSKLDDTVTEAIASRSDSDNFGTSSKRAILCYPRLKAYDAESDDEKVVPYSPYMAGVIAATDNTDGYWFSPSNREIKGITGTERVISAAVNDASTEANLLNESGIVTVFNSFGTGIRTWGNRAASFPTSTAPSNFISVQRTADILHESVELAMLQFIDQPISPALIDSIRDSVNGFINVLIQRGALIDGVCTFDPAKNPPVVTGAGQLIFDLTFMPPTPAERITFESYIDINLLASLGTNQ